MEWPLLTLKQAGVSLIDCVHATPSPVTSGYPYIAIPQMTGGRISFEDARQISDVDYVSWTKKAQPKKYDVVLSRRTNPGVVAPVQDRTQFALGQNLVLLRADGSNVAPEFLRWLTTSPQWWSQIEKFMNVGAIFNSLKCADVPKFQLPIPPLLEQKAIAVTLTALDDKIELNRRMNETLKASARALFRDWFVDFGPTRAKAEGRPAYLAPDLWTLFPDRMDTKSMPEGWTKSSVGTQFNLTMGQSPPGESYNDEGVGLPFFQGRTDFGDRYPDRRKFCSAPTRVAQPDDTLISVRAPVGDLNMAWELCCIGRGVAAARHKTGSRSFSYYGLAAIQSELRQFEDTGTVFGSINRLQFERLSFVEAPVVVISAFEKQVAATDEQIRCNTIETRTLAETRDTLLPKLMSGAIRVRDAESAVAALC